MHQTQTNIECLIVHKKKHDKHLNMKTGWWFVTFPRNVKFCIYKYMFMLDHHIPKTWKIQTTRVYIYI